MTNRQIEYYKKIGLWGDIIVMSNSVLLCTYVMWLEMSSLESILGKDFKHERKYRLNQVYKILDSINTCSIAFFKQHSLSVGEMCLDFTNAFEENLSIPDKELYIIYSLNEYCNKLNTKFDKHISSIFDKELRLVYELLKTHLKPYIQDGYLNVANAVVNSIMSKVTYKVQDNGEYTIVFAGKEIC